VLHRLMSRIVLWRGHGDDPTEVFKELLEVVDEWVEIFEKDGRALPEPKRRVSQVA